MSKIFYACRECGRVIKPASPEEVLSCPDHPTAVIDSLRSGNSNHPKRSTWRTYATTGYTHDVANDQRSAGGVHHHQVRRTATGNWQMRIEQANGRHRSYGPVTPISAAEGEALLARANKY